jgi:hypothetical protein
MKRVAALSVLPVVLLMTSCGAGKAADLVRPSDPSAAKALGDNGGGAICHDVHADGSHLIVDWQPDDRSDLEVAMKQGVAFVHYDCNSIRILPDCRADGVYGFIGTTRREQVINLKTADEAKANLPLHGGELGGSISANSSLDIGLSMVGKKSTTFVSVTANDMKGRCEGATHFVHAATVGAYAMQTDTAGSVTAAAQLFGFGASGGSSSSKSSQAKDGDLESCKTSDPDAPKPPAQCASPVRVQLIAVGPATASSAGPSTEISCPSGLVAVNGVCTASADDAAKKCQGGHDVASCESSCKARVVESCLLWGDLLDAKAEAEKSTAYDGPRDEAYQRACDLDDARGCGMSAVDHANGRGMAVDGQGAIDRAQKACVLGAPVGCTYMAALYDFGKGGLTQDRTKATHLYERACNAGDGVGCIGAAQAYHAGRPPGITVDLAKAADFLDRACDAGNAPGCLYAGQAYETGDGVTVDAKKALDFYKHGCDAKDPDACAGVKRLGGS